MLGTLFRRVTVKTLDVVVVKGRASERAPVRIAASVLDRAREAVGLDSIAPQSSLPDWSGTRVDQPMWPSDRNKLRKHQLDRGIIEEQEESSDEAPSEATAVVRVYYKRGCPYSRAAMDLLREQDIAFEEHDIKGDDATLSWLKTVTGEQTTPQMFIHGKSIGGFDSLRELHLSGRLMALVNEAPSSVADDELVDELEVSDLRARLDAGNEVRLVDVRTAAEIAQGMIPGAIHIELTELDARHGELDADDVWVVYCRSGHRSLTAVQTLRNHGFRSAVSLRGGLLAWSDSGGEVAPASSAKAPRRLPVIHPEHSPFEGLGVDHGEVFEMLEGDALIQRVREVLDECRPLVQADGGDIELLDVANETVHLQLTGNCIGCPSSQATLRQGIERRLKTRIPQIKGITSPQLV